MKYSLIILCFISITLQAQDKIALIPEPVQFIVSKGSFSLNAKTKIAFPSNKEVEEIAQLFIEKISASTGFNLAAGNKNKNSIELELNQVNDPEIGKEGYRLTVHPAKISLKANQPAGIFYGLQTLLQLLPPEVEGNSIPSADRKWEIPAVEILDYPRFGWRGLMLDVSRHYFPKEFVKKYIDQMVKYKFNVFHWHLTDDPGWRLEIEKYPKLTSVGAWRVPRTGRWTSYKGPEPSEAATDGGFYTKEDIKEIIQYAAARQVTVVPEIEVPGHSAAIIAAYPELSCAGTPQLVYPGSSTGLGNNVMCAGQEKTFEMLDGIFQEVAAMFPGPYIHIGGDEVDKRFWKACGKCQSVMATNGLKDEHELQSYFIKRVSSLLKKYNKKLIGWDEILEGGLAEDATVMSWRGAEGGIAAAKAGQYAVMSPLQYCYLDYQQTDYAIEQTGGAHLKLTDVYKFEPVPEGIDPKYILGGQGNLWTEYVPTAGRAEYMTWPRAFAIAEVVWSPKNERDSKAFLQRVETHFERFEHSRTNYSPAIYDPQIISVKDSKGVPKLTFQTEAEGVDIFYTMDDTYPDRYSSKYVGEPVAIPKGASTVKVITYRNGKPIGRFLAHNIEALVKRLP